MGIDHIETRVLFSDSTVTRLGQLSIAATMKDSWGIGRPALRVFGSYAIVYLLDGCGAYRDANGLRRRVSAGDLILVFPELGHAYGPGAGERWTEIYFVFSGPVFDFWRQAGLLNPARPITSLQPISHWLDVFTSFAEAVAASPPARRTEQVAEFLRILTSALSCESSIQDPAPAGWLVAAQVLLERNLHERLSLEWVAQSVNLSYETFRKRFRQETGLSPAEYRAGKRIAAARTLLEQGQLSLKQIAATLGFADEFCFSKRFKQTVGVSPGEFRRAMSRSQTKYPSPSASSDHP
jgi:AraC-like DNA-binding protein